MEKSTKTLIDPTAAPELLELRDATKSDPTVRKLVQDLKLSRVSLVLSGGGANGAYQAGAILALFDCEICNFVSIAGTSVGGLNAVLTQRLICSKKRDSFLELWCDLGFGGVMHASWMAIVKLVQYISAAPQVFQIPQWIQSIADGFWGEIDAELMSPKEFHVRTIVTMILTLLAVPLGAALLILLPPVIGRIIQFVLPEYEGSSGLAVLIVCGVIPFFAISLGSYFGWASNAPLRRKIEEFNLKEISQGQPAIICTLAEKLMQPIKRTPFLALRYRAHYIRLSRLESTNEIRDVLLQTASIPEIFSMRRLFGLRMIDGGLADNTPLLATFEDHPRTLIVSYLDSRLNRVSNLFDFECRRAIARIEAANCCDSDERKCWLYSLNLIPLIPSVKLGLFAWFSPRKSNWLLALGYRETLKALRNAKLCTPKMDAS